MCFRNVDNFLFLDLSAGYTDVLLLKIYPIVELYMHILYECFLLIKSLKNIS